MLQKIWKNILMRVYGARDKIEKIADCLGGEFTEEMLEFLLNGMSIVFALSPGYRRNIEGFSGRYVFRSIDGSFVVSASFGNGKMKVKEGEINDPHIRIFFRDPHSLMNFIFSPKPDVLSAMLNQEVTLEGNLNYLYKFAYMANHLRLKGPELLP